QHHVQSRKKVIQNHEDASRLTLENLQLYCSPPTPHDDVSKAPDIEARAADERSVHIGLGDELADIVRFDAATVDHPARVRDIRAEPLPQARPNVRVRLLG